MSSNREKEAYEYIKKAEQKQNPGFFSRLVSNKESRLEESLEYLEKAANIFKLLKNWTMAGKTQEDCAEIQIQLGNDPSSFYLEASHCYSFVDNDKSIKVQKKALEAFVNLGKFQQAGKIQKLIAEKYEAELNYEESAKCYKCAAEYFGMESMSSKSSEQACFIKYADILCSLPNNTKCYPECSNIYEKIAFQYLSVPLLKPSAKDLFFKSVCIIIAYGDLEIAKSKYNLYTNEDPTILETREDQFMKSAIDAVSEKAHDKFKQATTKYKTYTDFDKWKINVFKKIMDNLEENLKPDDFLGENKIEKIENKKVEGDESNDFI